MTNSMSLIEATGSLLSDAAGKFTAGARSPALTAGELPSTHAVDDGGRSHHELRAPHDGTARDALTSSLFEDQPQTLASAPDAWQREASAGLKPWRHPGTWLGAAVVLLIVGTLGLTIVLGWDGLLDVFRR